MKSYAELEAMAEENVTLMHESAIDGIAAIILQDLIKAEPAEAKSLDLLEHVESITFARVCELQDDAQEIAKEQLRDRFRQDCKTELEALSDAQDGLRE